MYRHSPLRCTRHSRERGNPEKDILSNRFYTVGSVFRKVLVGQARCLSHQYPCPLSKEPENPLAQLPFGGKASSDAFPGGAWERGVFVPT